MDTVVVGTILAVTGTIIVFAVLITRIIKLMNTTHSED